MEKKMWTLPRVDFVEFRAGDFCVSSCNSSTTGLSVLFECNAGLNYGESGRWKHPVTGDPLGWGGLLFIDNNHNGTFEETDTYHRYGACGTTHEVFLTDPDAKLEDMGIFFEGFYLPCKDDDGDGIEDSENTFQDVYNPVWIWHGEDGNSWHATSNLINTWQYSRS